MFTWYLPVKGLTQTVLTGNSMMALRLVPSSLISVWPIIGAATRYAAAISAGVLSTRASASLIRGTIPPISGPVTRR